MSFLGEVNYSLNYFKSEPLMDKNTWPDLTGTNTACEDPKCFCKLILVLTFLL